MTIGVKMIQTGQFLRTDRRLFAECKVDYIT
jgi:hypothetical protein